MSKDLEEFGKKMDILFSFLTLGKDTYIAEQHGNIAKAMEAYKDKELEVVISERDKLVGVLKLFMEISSSDKTKREKYFAYHAAISQANMLIKKYKNDIS